MNFVIASISKPGGREDNEDCCNFFQKGERLCAVVADGLGGHRGGEIASRLAVDAILQSFKDSPELSSTALIHHLEKARDDIVNYTKEERSLASMKTTVVAMIVDRESAMWAHVGDSRLYHFHKGRIIYETRDHSVPQAMADAGDIIRDQIREHEDRNRLLRAIGKAGDLRPTVTDKPAIIRDNDIFLLCTDGFWEFVTEPEMEKELADSDSPEDWLAKMESKIIERAQGEYDNYTAIAILVLKNILF